MRWIKVTKRDGDTARADYTYDEAGRVVYRRLTREGVKSKKDEVWLDQTGRIVRWRVNGEEVPME
jgi:YD repeat-containing protein